MIDFMIKINIIFIDTIITIDLNITNDKIINIDLILLFIHT